MRHKRADSAWIAINCLYQVNHLNQFELNFSFSSNKHALAHTHTQLSKGLKCWARANCNKHVHYHTIYSTISPFVAATTHRDHNPFCLENNDKPDKCRQVIEEGTQRAFVAWFIKQLYFSHLQVVTEIAQREQQDCPNRIIILYTIRDKSFGLAAWRKLNWRGNGAAIKKCN